MSIRHGLGRVVAILVATLLTGAFVYAVVASLGPNRITDAEAAGAALRGPAPTGMAAPAPKPAPNSTPTLATRPATPPPVVEIAAPSRLTIPSIDAELPVVPTGITTDQAMEIPDDPRIAGWYRFGPGPTTETGATVLSAHIDSRERVGPLARLDELSPGDEVVVTTADEEVRYVIERVDSYPKTVIDLDAIFDRTGTPRLHIVTCGGAWDPATGSYED
ncbi:MAG: class F sortase, partial [Dermatophilaceae bacterium]